MKSKKSVASVRAKRARRANVRIVRRYPKPEGYRPILTFSNAKTIKGEKLGWFTGILYMAPADLSGYQVCINAGNCKAPCLNLSGKGAMDRNQRIRIEKTRFYFEHTELFMACLRYDIETLVRRARRMRFGRRRMKPAVRVNGTSDLPKIVLALFAEFPEVQFYDYTKHPKSWLRVRPNYYITFSHDGPENVPDCLDALAHGINVAVCFDTRKGRPLPESWHGFPVIDGDNHDLRFLDPAGVVVGLRPKGRARKAITTGNPFIVLTTPAVMPACAMAAVA